MPIPHSYSAIYVAKPDYLKELCDELKDVSDVIGNLVFSPHINPDICFALDVWYEPQIVTFDSISEAAKILRQAGKYWYLYPHENFRRSQLICEQLRKLPPLQRDFPIIEALPDVGIFTLLDKNTLLYAAKRWKSWPMGDCYFNEDKTNPPNRAYLKLWESLTLLNEYPRPGETAFDLGASPGGWTYVMQSLGAEVTAIDKAHLDIKIARLPRVHYQQQSAFALDPAKLPAPIDWVLSDIACYPEKTYDLAMNWIASQNAKRLIFTIKLQGETDLATLAKFKAIPQGRVLHLFHNKHEATFIYPAPQHLYIGEQNLT